MAWLILLLFDIANARGQSFRKCYVYQFAGSESKKIFLALEQTYNLKGQLISEIYTNYKRNSHEGIDGDDYYYYKDTLLIKRLLVDHYKDTVKVLYHFNNENRVVREEYFECKRRLKKEVEKELVHRDVFLDKDFEKDRTWKKTTEISYTYDRQGRKIKRDEDGYTETWKYDSLNRISQNCFYEGAKLKRLEDYIYFPNGYKYSTVWYDDKGEPEKPEYSENIFNPIYTHNFCLDNKGNIVKEEIMTERNQKISEEITTYNKQGQIQQMVYLDGTGKPEITHVYVYKEVSR